MNGNSLIREIGRSYIVSSFIPAALFVYIFKIVFRDFIPKGIIQRIGEDSGLFGGSFPFLVLLSLWLGFALYSSQEQIIEFYEGYYCPWPIRPILTVIFLLSIWNLEKKYRQYQKWLENLPPKMKEKSLRYLYKEDLYPKLMKELQSRELVAPLEKDNFLPTRLGNVLRASEDYPYYRYGLDGVTIWPRLYDFLPNELKADLEEYNNHLAFFLNSSLLMLFIAVLSTSVALIELNCNSVPGIMHSLCSEPFWRNGFFYFSPNFYLIVGILGILSFYLLYLLGVAAAGGYALYVRTAFDLHRNKLLDHLNATWAKKLDDSRESWERLAHFYIADDLLGPVNIPKKSNKSELHIFTSLILTGGLIAGILYKINRRQCNYDC